VRGRIRRHNVGKLPPARPIKFLSVERTVEEGLLIALTAVRMAVKNQIILGVLRAKLRLLVAENAAHALRFRNTLDASPTSGPRGDPDLADAEAKRLELLEQVHLGLAAVLRTYGEDEGKVAEVVDAARQSAWDEIGDAWIARLTAELPPPLDADYRWQRAGRLQEFVYIDLAGLLLEHTESHG
jgi:hypothetical protein